MLLIRKNFNSEKDHPGGASEAYAPPRPGTVILKGGVQTCLSVYLRE